MTHITRIDTLINQLKKYISDCPKSYVTKSELKQDDNCVTIQDSTLFQLELFLVSKPFLLYEKEKTNMTRSRFVIKKFQNDNFDIPSKVFQKEAHDFIKQSIYSLTDTKYIIVLSNSSYEYLTNIINQKTILEFKWYKSEGGLIFLKSLATDTDRSIQSYKCYSQMKGDEEESNDVLNFKNFEEILVHNIKNVISGNRGAFQYDFRFCIFKVKDILLSILFPRVPNVTSLIVNIWPIIPIYAIQNFYNFIENLKISWRYKWIFRQLDESDYSNYWKIISLRHELTKGITIKQMSQCRITLKQVYVAYFVEYLTERVHYLFPSKIESSASYIQCLHCSILFDHVFGFVPHWLKVHDKSLFRCHCCNSRFITLSNLGKHYHEQHYDEETGNITEQKETFSQNPEFSNHPEDYIPKKQMRNYSYRCGFFRAENQLIRAGKMNSENCRAYSSIKLCRNENQEKLNLTERRVNSDTTEKPKNSLNLDIFIDRNKYNGIPTSKPEYKPNIRKRSHLVEVEKMVGTKIALI